MKRKGEGRTRTKSLAALKKTAWKLLSEIVRRTSADRWGREYCYTCAIPKQPWQQMQAAHAIPGRTGSTLLDEEIIRPCCARCNIWLRGNYPIFTTNLIKENGMEWWEHKLSESRHIKKWSRIELEEKIASYRQRLKDLETMGVLGNYIHDSLLDS